MSAYMAEFGLEKKLSFTPPSLIPTFTYSKCPKRHIHLTILGPVAIVSPLIKRGGG